MLTAHRISLSFSIKDIALTEYDADSSLPRTQPFLWSSLCSPSQVFFSRKRHFNKPEGYPFLQQTSWLTAQNPKQCSVGQLYCGLVAGGRSRHHSSILCWAPKERRGEDLAHKEEGSHFSAHAKKCVFCSLVVVPLLAGINGLLTMATAIRQGMGDVEVGGGGGGGSFWQWRLSGDGGGGDSYGSSKYIQYRNAHDRDDSPSELEQEQVIIVVPTLNEASSIVETLTHLRTLHPRPTRIIVVDGGSSDATVTLAEAHGATTVRSPQRGRANQMNHGAFEAIRAAQGNGCGLLCFIHADTIVPTDLVDIIRRTMADPRTVCGGFVPVLVTPNRTLWFASFRNVVKTWMYPLLLRPVAFFRGLRILFGDQVMFCRVSDFAAVGGFNQDLSIMEDADLCVKLNRAGLRSPQGDDRRRVQLVSRLVVTSGRRFEKLGILKVSLINFCIGLSYGLGAQPRQINALYKRLYHTVR